MVGSTILIGFNIIIWRYDILSKVIFNTVIIEVTRRCNMSCPHCLRGDAQNVDMDLYIR